jgi:hypothetical protein
MDVSKLVIKKVLISESGKVVVKAPQKLPEDLPRVTPKAPCGTKIIQVSLEPKTRNKRSQQGVNGHWMFDSPLCQGHQFGFIYLIHDTINSRMYIGKKQYFGAGKKNRGEETNWKWYTSSCTALQKAIKANSKEGFKFYVLDEYRVRGTLGFAETWSLMQVEAPANRDKWYNMLVNKISWTVKEGISAKHKERLKAICEGKSDTLTIWSETDA